MTKRLLGTLCAGLVYFLVGLYIGSPTVTTLHAQQSGQSYSIPKS